MENLDRKYLNKVITKMQNENIFNLNINKPKQEIQLIDDLSEIKLFKINEITYEEEEGMPRKEAFENVLGTIREKGINFIYLILGNKKGVSFYFGIVRDLNRKKELSMPVNDMAEKLLKSAIQGNFRGSKIEKVSAKESKNILEKLSSSQKFATITGTPGINDTKDNNNFQGVDRLVDVMLGDEFGLCIVSKPLSMEAIYNLENQIYDIYNKWSVYAKANIQTGSNQSESLANTAGTNTSISKGTNESYTKGSSQTTSTNENKNVSISEGENISRTASLGSSKSKSNNSSYTKGANISHTAGESSGTNSSSGSSSSSSGKNKGKNTSETAGENTSNTSGSSKTVSSSENQSKSIGTSETKTSGKSVGTSDSEGTNKSVSYGTNDNKTTGENASKSQTSSQGTSATLGIEQVNKKIQDYMKYIDELLLPMLDYGKSKGLFVNNFFIFAKDNGTIRKLGNTVSSLYSGKVGNKNPLSYNLVEDRNLIDMCKNLQIPEYIERNITIEDRDALTFKSYFIENEYLLKDWYSANELSIVGGLPQKEVIGLGLKKEIEFGLNIPTNEIKDGIILGKLVQSGNIIEDSEVVLNKKDFNKHIFITGTTGSGKTTTCQRLILESYMPFMVIEPAKTEYRILKDNPTTKDILIFTLGQDTVAPFRLNPFEFFKGESITSRVDMIKGAIEATMDMEAAIPQLIESTIYQCYKDYGWNIKTDENDIFDDPFEKGVHSFPTLSDVINKVEDEVKKQGFDDRLKNDYIGSIKGRLNGLIQGSKGLMLDVYRGVDFVELMDKKVIFEIENIKNEGEKSLIMGFILTNICEALKIKHNQDNNFKHITLVEEAHKLLSKYTPGDSPTKKQGVTMFADMLAEIRKYGESLIIVDQIANKLTPEVLKNTNTKIVHKIFAEDDKEAIGNTMALSQEQKEFLQNLQTGRAIVFSQGWEKPIQTQITLSTDTTNGRTIQKEELTDTIMEFYRERYQEGMFYGSNLYKIKPTKEEFDEIINFNRNMEVRIFNKMLEFNNINDEKEILTIIKTYVKNRKALNRYILGFKKLAENITKLEKYENENGNENVNIDEILKYINKREFENMINLFGEEMLVILTFIKLYGDLDIEEETVIYDEIKKIYNSILLNKDYNLIIKNAKNLIKKLCV